MKESELLLQRINSGEVFFFAGSGICYDSGLPSAISVLDRTSKVFLPKRISTKIRENIVKSIQPEVFYESLINITGKKKCLHLWRVLCERDQKLENFSCKPNLVHRFIAKYSSINQVPIFTTNFDPMFELACEEEKIKYRVFLPKDNPPTKKSRSLVICKLHGSVQNIKSEFTPDSLGTTMTDITKVNIKWIDFINKIMQKKHISFVGYSGRDIDLFPYLVEIASTSKKAFWISQFSSDYSDIASQYIGAIRINQWPKQFLLSKAKDLIIKPTKDIFDLSKYKKSIGFLLEKLQLQLETMKILNNFEKRFFYCDLITKISDYKKAHQLNSTLLKEQNFKYLKKIEALVLLSMSRLSHEVSHYIDSRKYAKRVLSISRINNDLDSKIQALCLISESFRMAIPKDYYFFNNLAIIFFPLLIIVILHFLMSLINIYISMFINKKSFRDLSINAQHEVIEHVIRFVAIFQSIFGNPKTGWNENVRKILRKIWLKIKEFCKTVGNASGIANAGRFLDRLIEGKFDESESNDIYFLITYSTGKELVKRNIAEKLLLNGNVFESKKIMNEYIYMAKDSGNKLNEIKGLLGIAYINYTTKHFPLLRKSEQNRLNHLSSLIQGKLWKALIKRFNKLYL